MMYTLSASSGYLRSPRRSHLRKRGGVALRLEGDISCRARLYTGTIVYSCGECRKGLFGVCASSSDQILFVLFLRLRWSYRPLRLLTLLRTSCIETCIAFRWTLTLFLTDLNPARFLFALHLYCWDYFCSRCIAPQVLTIMYPSHCTSIHNRLYLLATPISPYPHSVHRNIAVT